MGISYAGFWKRFFATILDWLIFGFISTFIIFMITEDPVLGGLLGLFFSWVYYAGMESSQKQATVGKMILRIIVSDLNGNRISFGRATGRFFAEIISAVFTLGIGLLMIAFTQKKQGLHDLIARCLVINRNS